MTRVCLTVFGWIALCGLVLTASWLLTIFRLYRLDKYLKKTDYQKWREITSIGKSGPGLSNPFRSWSYVLKDADEADEELLRLKDAARASMRYSFVWVGTLVISLLAGFIIIYTVCR